MERNPAVWTTSRADGSVSTLLLVETAESEIVWTEPRDMPLATLTLKIDFDRKGISGRHGIPPSIWNFWSVQPPDGANAIFCDGHGQFLSHTIPPEKLRALITINGGERQNEDDF